LPQPTAAFALGVHEVYTTVRAQNLGRQLNYSERSLYEKYFPDKILSDTRVHEGNVPKWLRSDMSGITLKNDIYFREGVYVPDTGPGVEILGHELVHVHQFSKGMSYFDYIFKSLNGYMNNPYEIEAYRRGAEIRKDFCIASPGKPGC
jgi:hypothetical protein